MRFRHLDTMLDTMLYHCDFFRHYYLLRADDGNLDSLFQHWPEPQSLC